MNYLISSAKWQWIKQRLQDQKGLHTSNIEKLRTFIEDVVYILKAGCQWRMLPPIYGHWRAVHKRFKAWADRGVWKNLFVSAQSDPDMELTILDATIVKALCMFNRISKKSMVKECLGRTAGGLTSKIHAVVDALGNPLKIILTAGQVSDIKQAQSLTSDIDSCVWIADKGYDCDYFVNTLYEKHCTTIIPSRKNRLAPRHIDSHVYKERHLVECFFNKIKWFRRVHVRYDKTAAAYLAFVHLASTFVWLS